ncbi:hypothetical protein CFOL_v3_06515 [Cephalotus follicularis]|uniref:Uncharacterized protein n=1 Tax=Cephalotus follicularis TaxID=3775 RepID=A0A1Q3B5C8_CEPFO|nr:hypothetical protein CFOL_v3_06515 [Cephalotus follicularis]
MEETPPACASSTEEPNDPIVTVYQNPTVEDQPTSSKPIKKKKKKRVFKDASALGSSISSSSCSAASSMSCSTGKGTRVGFKRRSPKVMVGSLRGNGGDVEAIALPLGMSFAAVLSEVLERKDAASERMSVDHLSMICTSAVRESLANVFGDKFDCFARNFEKSFGSTLRTLRLINESMKKGGFHLNNFNIESSMSDMIFKNKRDCISNSGMNDSHSETNWPSIANRQLNIPEEVQERMSKDREVALCGQTNQLLCISSSTSESVINPSMLTTIEKSVVEQIRSNDLKTLELGLTMRRLKLKETQVALNYDSNHLERSKLAMGVSKASFKAEKFKNQLEDMRHVELLKKCIDCLVAGLFVMSVSLSYGAYVFSYKRITEATSVCAPLSQESNSWWMPKPMSSFNSGWNLLKCQASFAWTH